MQKPKIKPISIAMSYQWYHKRGGADYSEPNWHHPIKHVEQERDMNRVLHDHYGKWSLGSANPEPRPCIETYGDRFIPALFGCEIVYRKDQAPSALHIPCDVDTMSKLTVPDFEKSPVMRKAFEDAKALINKYGYCHTLINTGSPLNAAVSIFGQEFLSAIALEPEVAQHVLRMIGETFMKVYREFTHGMQPDMYPYPQVYGDFGNCPAIMVSPRMYREVILPVDKWYRSHFPKMNIHHCGIIDKYIHLYKELDPEAIDVGGRSDYVALRKAFPNTTFSLIINTCDAESKTPEQIYSFVGDMVNRAQPYDKISQIWINEISLNTPDHVIGALATAHEVI